MERMVERAMDRGDLRLVRDLGLLGRVWEERATAQERLRAEVGELTERKLKAMLSSDDRRSRSQSALSTERRPPRLVF